MSTNYDTVNITVTDQGVEIWSRSEPGRFVVIPEREWFEIVRDWQQWTPAASDDR